MPPRLAYTAERLQEAAKTAETKAREYVVSKKWDGVTIACRWLRTCTMYHKGGTERRPNVVSPSFYLCLVKAFSLRGVMLPLLSHLQVCCRELASKANTLVERRLRVELQR